MMVVMVGRPVVVGVMMMGGLRHRGGDGRGEDGEGGETEKQLAHGKTRKRIRSTAVTAVDRGIADRMPRG